MARKKKTTTQQRLELLYGKKNASHPMYRTVDYVHNQTVRECSICGRPMSRSDVNDYGSLCYDCYMKEYYR